jgi:hypothetical protein
MLLNLRAERTTVDELLDDVLLDYKVNEKATRFAESVINNLLRPYFKRRPAISIGTSDVQKYVQFRQGANQGTLRYRGRRKMSKSIAIGPASIVSEKDLHEAARRLESYTALKIKESSADGYNRRANRDRRPGIRA